jgi:hypothetical protein
MEGLSSLLLLPVFCQYLDNCIAIIETFFMNYVSKYMSEEETGKYFNSNFIKDFIMKTYYNCLPNFKLLLIGLLSVILVSFSSARSQGDQITEMKNYIDKSGEEPSEYVISKFKDNDIIIINQFNSFRHEVDFVKSLISPLQKQNIHFLAIEYGNESDQAALDKIISAVNFNDEAAKSIISNFNEYGVWEYQEYLELFKEAWKTNRVLSKNDKKFRILLLNSPGTNLIERSRFAPSIIYKEIISKGEKAVIYSTALHSLNNNGEFSNFIQYAITPLLGQNKSIFSINFHSPWIILDKSGNSRFELTKPMNGMIDEVFSKNGNKPVGFDIKESPFENLLIEASYYNNNKNRLFKNICNGYIFLVPFERYEALTCMLDFLRKTNLQDTRKYSEK